MKILVTGGAGFIGSHVVDLLLDERHEPVIIDNLVSGNKKNIPMSVKFYDQDLLDAPKLKTVFEKEKFEAVIHLAAQKSVTASVEDPIFDMKNNIQGSLTLFEQMKDSGVKKIVFISTGGALYGDAKTIPTVEASPIEPISPYGIAKFSIENYLRFYRLTYGFSPTVLRLANVYGPRQDPKGEAGVIAIFCNKVLAGENVTVFGDGIQTRDYVFVKDVARAAMVALKKDKRISCNIGTGIETNIIELVEDLGRVSGKKIGTVFAPARSGELPRSALNCTLANKELGWSYETELEQGLKETLEYFKQHSSID
jgi:UDP-glucose 4-epimerase